MINMSYCRFHNTLIALRECLDALGDADGDPLEQLSEEERKAARKLLKVCRILADDYGDE